MDYCRLAYLNGKLERIYQKNPKMPKINVHAFRHTHASLLLAAGASIKDVQVRLGHSDIQTTMSIYTHVTDEVKEKTAAMFQEYMKFWLGVFKGYSIPNLGMKKPSLLNKSKEGKPLVYKVY